MRTPTSDEGWNHNAHHHELLLAAVPRPCARALDVGCGLGAFARRLVGFAGDVDAIDRDSGVLARARERSAGIANLELLEADFLAFDPPHRYDFVSFVATLHHLPFAEAMARATALLRPGGVLAVLGLDRSPSWFDPRNVLSLPISVFHRMTRPVAEVGAPIVDPTMTFEEIKQAAHRVVPGAAIQRRLLWRYTLLWTKP